MIYTFKYRSIYNILIGRYLKDPKLTNKVPITLLMLHFDN